MVDDEALDAEVARVAGRIAGLKAEAVTVSTVNNWGRDGCGAVGRGAGAGGEGRAGVAAEVGWARAGPGWRRKWDGRGRALG